MRNELKDQKKKQSDLIDCGVDVGLIEKSGTWYSYKGEGLGQGKENVKKLLLENKEISSDLDQAIRKIIGLSPSEPYLEKKE